MELLYFLLHYIYLTAVVNIYFAGQGLRIKWHNSIKKSICGKKKQQKKACVTVFQDVCSQTIRLISNNPNNK